MVSFTVYSYTKYYLWYRLLVEEDRGLAFLGVSVYLPTLGALPCRGLCASVKATSCHIREFCCYGLWVHKCYPYT